jgi:predicted amidohydrolase
MTRLLTLAMAQARRQDLNSFCRDAERRVEASGCDLLIYPEYHVVRDGSLDPSGQHFNNFAVAEAEPLNAERGFVFAQLAADLKTWLIPGTVVERAADGLLYNTATVYSPEGRLAASYRKVFPFLPGETITRGTRFVVFDMVGFGQIGLSVCYDAWFPEVSRHLAWMGAELVVNVVATGTNDREQEVVLARANAIVNQNFVASVNGAGPEGMGRSLLVDPEGRVRVQSIASEDVTLVDVIDLDTVQNVRTRGTAAVNRPWHQFTESDAPVDLPFYDGRIDPIKWSQVAADVQSPSGEDGARS